MHHSRIGEFEGRALGMVGFFSSVVGKFFSRPKNPAMLKDFSRPREKNPTMPPASRSWTLLRHGRIFISRSAKKNPTMPSAGQAWPGWGQILKDSLRAHQRFGRRPRKKILSCLMLAWLGRKILSCCRIFRGPAKTKSCHASWQPELGAAEA